MIVDEVLIVSELHYGDFVFLTLLPELVDFSVAIFEEFPALPDLVLQTRSLVLEADSHFPDFSVDHRLPLALHHASKVLQFFRFTSLCGLIAALPLFDLLKEICIFILLGLVLLLEREINVIELILEHFILVVESLANFVQFLVLLAVLVDLLLLRETFFRQLSNLNLVVTSVKELPLVLFELDSQHLNFLGQPFDLDGLKNNDELYVIPEISLLVVGQVLNAGPMWVLMYFLRSSP